MAEYTDMTDEEYDALDEELTRTIPKLGPDGTDWFSQMEMRLWGLADETVKYLIDKAMASHKTPAQLVDEIVGKEMAAKASRKTPTPVQFVDEPVGEKIAAAV
jgi:hypothetical protein